LKTLYSLLKQCTQNGKVEVSKRLDSIRKFGSDTKYLYHVVRLLNEVEQIMVEQDLDLERNREQLKSIRRGEWKIEDVEEYFNRKEKELEKVYSESKLRYSPDEGKVKHLLLNCLEMHFGSLNNAIIKENEVSQLVQEIQEVIDKYRIIK